MLPRIKSLEVIEKYILRIVFDDDAVKHYDMSDDINTLPGYDILMEEEGLFDRVNLDESRTIVYWNSDVDLPSDILYEYGKDPE